MGDATRDRAGRTSRSLSALAVVGCLLGAVAGGTPASAETVPGRSGPSAAVGSELVPVLLGARDGAEPLAAAVTGAGGRVTRSLPLIDAQAALVPSAEVARLAHDPAVAWLVPDAQVRLAHSAAGASPAVGPGSVFHVADTVRAKQVWEQGFTGAGVDVAVIDSGVVPVDGLTAPGKVVDGPDLSFESGNAALRHLDGFGHGTHIAGIIAGRDGSVPAGTRTPPHEAFVGVAPDARIVNLKVADASGGTDVSQVIAAIDWVVQHGRSGGLNVRVLNLSLGTDGVQAYQLDPLSHAVERAWHRGVVVVVSAGNDGRGDGQVDNPALNPYVIAVGGSDSVGTVRPDDDVVAPWSSPGEASRRPDLVAPGTGIVSLRDPGSRLDTRHPQARVGERLFRGSGTSQSAGVVSGAAALLLQQRPGLTPDQVKALLTGTARPLPLADRAAQGAGLLDVQAAAKAPTPSTRQTWTESVGTGSLEEARGSTHVLLGDQELVGEQSVFLTTWDAVGWTSSLLGGLLSTGPWSGGGWHGTSWTGTSWTGGAWMGTTWNGTTWDGTTWNGTTWNGTTWNGTTWNGTTWNGSGWTGTTWNGSEW
jgi:serine protease AprX